MIHLFQEARRSSWERRYSPGNPHLPTTGEQTRQEPQRSSDHSDMLEFLVSIIPDPIFPDPPAREIQEKDLTAIPT